MQSQPHPPQRKDSPSGHLSSLNFASHGDPFVHTPQQLLCNPANMESSGKFTPFTDGESQPSAGPFDTTSFHNNSILGAFFPPRTRPSVAGSSSSAVGSDSNTVNYTQYDLSAADVFGTHQALQLLAQ